CRRAAPQGQGSECAGDVAWARAGRLRWPLYILPQLRDFLRRNRRRAWPQVTHLVQRGIHQDAYLVVIAQHDVGQAVAGHITDDKAVVDDAKAALEAVGGDRRLCDVVRLAAVYDELHFAWIGQRDHHVAVVALQEVAEAEPLIDRPAHRAEVLVGDELVEG